MATIDHLIDKISNPELQQKLRFEFERLQKQKRFGLVFEDHLPEATLLYEVEVRKGQKVTLKESPLEKKYEVLNIDNGVARCVLLDSDGSVNSNESQTISSFSIFDLLPFADFGDPIYPYLEPLDKIKNAPESDLWHEVIEADNFHALQLLAYLYPGKVDCIYIDPPYNTGARDWKYNNDYVDSTDAYRHSKWLSMMRKRLLLAKKLLNPNDSVLIVTIDEKEYNHLGCLLEELFVNANIQMISSVIAQKGVARNNSFYRINEYLYIIQFGTSKVTPLPLSSEWKLGKGESAASKGIVWSQLRRSGTNDLRSDRENLFYPIYFNLSGTKIIGIGETLEPSIHPHSRIELNEDKLILWPIKDSGIEGNWQLSAEELKERLKKGYVRIGNYKNNNIPVSYLKKGSISKIENNEVELLGYDETSGTVIVNNSEYQREFIPGSQWNIQNHDATYKGSQLLSKLIGTRFDFPKSLYAVHDTLRFFVANKPNALIIDFFAGSGTTLHAVNLLNKEDGGNRRCIMVTNNEVSEEEEQSLRDKGLTPADEEWKALGIARYVTWPRTVASVSGYSVNGNLINGDYLTYIQEEKETSRKFIKISFVKEFSMLSLAERKHLVSQLSDKKIAKNKVSEDTRYLIDEYSEIAILLDDSSTENWLDELESADQIKTFYIVTQNNKLFNSLKKHIAELLGPYKETVPLTFPMAEGFKANVEFFHLGFLDKNAVARNKQFKEILPLLWLKAGGLGDCPAVPDKTLPPYLILPQNNFAVLIEEYAFSLFAEELKNTSVIDTLYIVTNSTSGYREMIKVLNPKQSFQLYRDYLDNFRINYIQ